MALDSVTAARVRADAVERRPPAWVRDLQHDWPIHTAMILGMIISLIPVAFMLMISVKSLGQFITQPLGLTRPFNWENYVIAWNVIKHPMMISAILVVINTSFTLLVASVTAYVFARFRFPGREFFFWLVLGVMFIPSILTFATRFVLVVRLGMLDTLWAMIIPVVAGSQVGQIFFLRSFFASLSEDILESARIDGAGVMRVFFSIVVPMSRPIIATLAVMQAMSVWGSWLWPSVVIRTWANRPMALQVLYLASDIGLSHFGRQMAGYVIATVPMVVLFVLASKQFVEGITSGAMKF